jgi:hypothetical protein
MAAAAPTRRAAPLALLLWAAAAGAAPPATQPAATRPAAAASSQPDAQVIVDPEDHGPPAASQPVARPASPAGRGFLRDFSFHGYVRSTFALDTKHEGRRAAVRNDPRPVEDVMDWRSQAYFRATLALGPRLRAVASGWLDHVGDCERPRGPGEEYWVFNGAGCRWELEPTLGETYVEASLRRVDLRAGLQVVPWGANELLGPADVINPRDLRRGMFVDPETARLPVPAVRLTVYPATSLALEALWVPFFVPHRLDLFGSDYAVLGPAAPYRCGTGLCPLDPRAVERALADAVDPSLRSRLQPLLLQTRFPAASLRNGAAGARVVWRPAGFDLSLAYYYGLEQYPTARLDPDAATLLTRLVLGPGTGDGQAAARELVDRVLAGQPVYESTYRRFHLAAASAMRAVGPVVLKLDAAWSPRRTLYQRDEVTGALGSVDGGVFSFAAGADYTRGDTLLVSLEVYGLRPLVDDERRRSLLYTAGAGLYGLIGLAEWRLLRGDLGFRLYGFCDLGHPGYILGPEASYRVREWLTLRLGGSFLGGEDLSLPGSLRFNDQVYVGVKGAW